MFTHTENWQWEGQSLPLLIKQINCVNIFNEVLTNFQECSEDTSNINKELIFEMFKLFDIDISEYKEHTVELALTLFNLYQEEINNYIDNIFKSIEKVNEQYKIENSKETKEEAEININKLLSRIPKDNWNNLTLAGGFDYIHTLDNYNEKQRYNRLIEYIVANNLLHSKSIQSEIMSVTQNMFPQVFKEMYKVKELTREQLDAIQQSISFENIVWNPRNN